MVIPNTSTLLCRLNPHKTTGPDQISPRLLKEIAKQIIANIIPLFKKGDRNSPVNYHPVSLTSACSKVMGHIFHSHIIKHIDILGLLADSQHGFRKRRSTETQLILSIDDLAKCLDEGEQMDCILLDFSKAFDKAPHSRLLMKLQLYGVRGYLHDWITSLPLGRTQCVVLDGPTSAATTFLQESPRSSSWALSCSYFSLTTCHLSSHQPPDCLQMTVFV